MSKLTTKAKLLALQGLVARRVLRRLRERNRAEKQEMFQRFADQLNEVRLHQGLTFEQLAGLSSVKGNRVKAIMHGDFMCGMGELVNICLALKVRAGITMTQAGNSIFIPIGIGGSP